MGYQIFKIIILHYNQRDDTMDMDDFNNTSSQRYREKIEEVECPFCNKAKVSVTYIAGYMSWRVSRISAGSKRTRFFHDPKIKVNSSCPNCKASRQDIKDALERGVTNKLSHEERIKRFKERGLPTVIQSY